MTTTTELDPRIIAAGGTPRGGDPKNGYDYAGMMDASNWAKTDVGKATNYYACAFCGQKFKGPHAVYTHIAKVHPSKAVERGAENVWRAALAPSGADAGQGPVLALSEAS